MAKDDETCGGGNAQELPSGKEHILLVEDEAGVRRITRSVLTRLGYQVTDAANAGEALRLWSDPKDEFDLLLTDVIMPGGVNGVQMAFRLTEERPDLKVIFMS